MADGAQKYGYGSRLQVFVDGQIKTGFVVGPKPEGRMMVRMMDEPKMLTVMPFGNGWTPDPQVA